MTEPESDRPWEQPGAVRRDCEPHRGELLLRLSFVGVSCSLLASCLWAPAFVAVGLGAAVLVMAARDLKKMRAGVMDPAGRAQTEEAHDLAEIAVFLGMAFLVLIALAFGSPVLSLVR
jgi:hypothetical protein